MLEKMSQLGTAPFRSLRRLLSHAKFFFRIMISVNWPESITFFLFPNNNVWCRADAVEPSSNSSKLNNRKTLNNVAQPVISSLDNRDDNPNILNGHETPDASSESINDPHPLSNGVHASTSNAVELKEIESNANYPPQFHGIPPPPAFVNHFNEAQTNDEQSSSSKSTTHQT